MYRLCNVLTRQTWRNAHACVNKRLIVNMPLLSARALETCRLNGRVCGSQGNKSRLVSSNSVEAEEGDLNPYSLIGEDIKDVYEETLGIFRKYIRNKDMFNIANHYFHIKGDTAGIIAALGILLSKALNLHMYKDVTLTDTQRKAIGILEVLMDHIILRDDILDSSNIRLGCPSAHKCWSLYQVIVTGNMLLGIIFGEASKLTNDISISLGTAHEILQKGHSLHFRDIIDGDLWGHYLTTHDFKSASVISLLATVTAQGSGARKSLVDICAKLGYNMGFLWGVVDDITDFKEDVASGQITAPTIFAIREYPELKEMMLRRFAEEGDVENAIELVNKSQGFEEARTLARMYHRFTMRDLRLLADSPYRRALETFARLLLQKTDPGKGENFLIDF